MQYIVLFFRNDLCFHNYKLSRKIHESGQSDRNISYEIKSRKVIEQELRYKFRIDPYKGKFNMFRAIKTLIDKISTILFGRYYKFKSDNIIKLKAMKFIVKKILPE